MLDYTVIFSTLPCIALEILSARLRLPLPELREAPYEVLTDAGYCAASAVVALAPSPLPEAREAIERIMGRPILVLPPMPRAAPYAPTRTRLLDKDDRVLAIVKPNPRLPTTPSFWRYSTLKPGMSVRTYIARVGDVGWARRDLREWTREGSIQLSEPPIPPVHPYAERINRIYEQTVGIALGRGPETQRQDQRSLFPSLRTMLAVEGKEI